MIKFQPNTGLLYSPAEIIAWQARMVNGPYKTLGDAYPNSPAEWNNTIDARANTFVKAPIVPGTGNSPTLTQWVGYPGATVDTGGNNPVHQGINQMQAAFRYLLTKNPADAQAVKSCLMGQIGLTQSAGYSGLRFTTWAPYKQGSKPDKDSGTKEGLYYFRMAMCYDMCREVFTDAEAAQVISYLGEAAAWFRDTLHNKTVTYLPDRLTNNYTTRKWHYTNNDPSCWFVPAKYDRYAVYGAAKDRVYTHTTANGTPVNRIPFAAFNYNNRDFERIPLMCAYGILAQDKLMITHVKQFIKEWLMFSVFPDGTYGEYERNGDYGVTGRGAYWYGSLNVQAALLATELLSRVGDNELRNFSTTDGVLTTACQTGQPAKSLKSVIVRYIKGLTGVEPLYYNGQVIDGDVPEPTMYKDGHLVMDHLLAIAGKLYPDLNTVDVYQRRATGTVPLRGINYSAAYSVPIFFSGTGAEFPSLAFMFGALEAVKAYPNEQPFPVTNSGITVKANTPNITFVASLAGATQFTWEIVSSYKFPMVINTVAGKSTLVISNNGSYLPVGKHTFNVTAVSAQGMRCTQGIDFYVTTI